ncbi:MAG: hypothetical protein WCK51_08030 [Armatimonadota bacterium]
MIRKSGNGYALELAGANGSFVGNRNGVLVISRKSSEKLIVKPECLVKRGIHAVALPKFDKNGIDVLGEVISGLGNVDVELAWLAAFGGNANAKTLVSKSKGNVQLTVALFFDKKNESQKFRDGLMLIRRKIGRNTFDQPFGETIRRLLARRRGETVDPPIGSEELKVEQRIKLGTGLAFDYRTNTRVHVCVIPVLEDNALTSGYAYSDLVDLIKLIAIEQGVQDIISFRRSPDHENNRNPHEFRKSDGARIDNGFRELHGTFTKWRRTDFRDYDRWSFDGETLPNHGEWTDEYNSAYKNQFASALNAKVVPLFWNRFFNRPGDLDYKNTVIAEVPMYNPFGSKNGGNNLSSLLRSCVNRLVPTR